MAFTSTLISTANLGTWDYFIMTDNAAVWRSMNGLASWFAASSGVIQSAAWLGALLLLAMFVYGAATQSKMVGVGTLGGWFFFMSMMGITGTAQVTNVYTNQVTLIANVPALALIPSSIFSKAAHDIFISMETAFQSVNGSYMSVDQNAFVGPLDILLSLRSSKAQNSSPNMYKSLVQVVHDCAEVPNGPVVANTLSSSKDALAWLEAHGRQTGLTKIYSEGDTSGQGTIFACGGPGGALETINTLFTVFAGGSQSFVGFLNAATTKKNPLDSEGKWDAATVPNSWGSLFSVIPGIQQSSLEFTKNALVATTINNTLGCMSQSGMLTSSDNCLASAFASADGKERWKIEAAMAGSGFMKTMFESMGFLQVMFFALFPFIAVYGLVVAHKTLAVFGGYVLIGIWSQSVSAP